MSRHILIGWLCEGDPEQFAIAMRKVDSGDIDLKFIGMNGRKRVEQKFSFTAFTDSLDELVLDCAALDLTEAGPRDEGGTTLFTKFALAFHFSLAMMVLFWMVFYTPLP